MKVLLDTNVLVAAFVARGQCHELLEHCVRSHRLITSEHILDELERVLRTKLGFPPATVEEAVDLVAGEAVVASSPTLEGPVSRDPEDDRVLAAAAAAGCDCLVTGDQDLLVLGSFREIPVLEPSAFWEFEASRRPGDRTPDG